MKSSVLLTLLFGLYFLMGCGTIMPSKSTQDTQTVYSEDISSLRARPKVIEQEVDTVEYYATTDSTSLPITEKLNTVLDTAAAHNRATVKFVDGFTIQVYGGNDRAAAKEYQLDIIRNFPNVESKMVFEQPNYKVRIGQYYTRLEAQEFFKEIRVVFPRAILIPTRIYLQN